MLGVVDDIQAGTGRGKYHGTHGIFCTHADDVGSVERVHVIVEQAEDFLSVDFQIDVSAYLFAVQECVPDTHFDQIRLFARRHYVVKRTVRTPIAQTIHHRLSLRIFISVGIRGIDRRSRELAAHADFYLIPGGFVEFILVPYMVVIRLAEEEIQLNGLLQIRIYIGVQTHRHVVVLFQISDRRISVGHSVPRIEIDFRPTRRFVPIDKGHILVRRGRKHHILFGRTNVAFGAARDSPCIVERRAFTAYRDRFARRQIFGIISLQNHFSVHRSIDQCVRPFAFGAIIHRAEFEVESVFAHDFGI